MHWIGLLLWMVLCFAVAGMGGRWTAAEVKGWYRTLTRPAIAPPNWVFGPVWTVLYAAMAVWGLAGVAHSADARTQLGAGAVFSCNWRSISPGRGSSFANMPWAPRWLRWCCSGWRLARRPWHSAGFRLLGAFLMVPYLVWVAFATALNAAFWRLD